MWALTLDPDRDEARQWLERELARGEYNRPESIVERIIGWLAERLSFVVNLIPGVGGLASVIIVVVVLAAVISAVLLMRGRWRHRAMQEKATGAVLDDPTLSAVDYRRRAKAAIDAGDWDAALLDSYRAIAADAVDRVLVDDRPGRTAHEVATELGPPFPDHQAALAAAADTFDDVRYGERHTTRERALTVRDLDAAIRKARPRQTDRWMAAAGSGR